MRVVFVQYAGDYREAALRIAATGEETYYAQRYSVEAVAQLTARYASVTVVCCLTATAYDEMLPNGVRAVGAGYNAYPQEAELIELVAKLEPEALIVRMPAMRLLRWAADRHIRTIAVLADSFGRKGLRGWLRARQLAAQFNHPGIEWIFNHGLNSCVSLRRIGVKADKIVPWDWPALLTPAAEAKTLPATGALQLLFVGMVTEDKGVGDVLRAVALLKDADRGVSLQIAGGGEIEAFAELARTLGIADRVQFLGLQPHRAILEAMRAAHVVAVPSRHAYSEGFPMTIYEALCARTPIVASDHPMFRSNLTNEVDALIYPAGNAQALADALARLAADPELYRKLSVATANAWEQLQLPVKWAEAMDRWLANSAEDRAWLFERRLSSGIYPLHRYEPRN